MQNFNKHPFLQVLGTLFIFFLVAASLQAQDSKSKKIIIKERIVSESGDVDVIEREIDVPTNETIIINEDTKAKARIRIQSQGDLGVEEEIIILPGDQGEKRIIWSDKKMDCDKGNSFFFSEKNQDFRVAGVNPFFSGDPSLEFLKVIILPAGAEIPEEILQDIIDMGLDVETVQQKFDEAERMVYLSQIGEEPALIEVDGPEPPHMKGFHLQQNMDDVHFLPKDMDFDFDFDFDIELDDENMPENFYFNGTLPKGLLEENPELLEKLQNQSGENFRFELNPEGDYQFFFNEEGNLEMPQFELLKEELNNMDKEDAFIFGNVQPDKAQLGVYLGEMTEEGITVSSIIEGSAAEEAGIQENDIITAINGRKVADTDQLIDQIKDYKIGEQINVSILRGGEQLSVQATLKGKKEEFRFDKMRLFQEGRNSHHAPNHHRYNSFWNKMDCESLCNAPFLGVMISDSEAADRVNIISIFEGTQAEKADLQENDQIISIDGFEAINTSAVIEAVQRHEPGDVVSLTYQRGEEKASIEVTIGRKTDTPQYDYCDCENNSFKQQAKPDKKEIIILKQPLAEETVPEEDDIISLPSPDQRPLFNNQLELSEFQLFPNPNSGRFTIRFNSSSEAPITITVVDATGKELFRDAIQSFSGNYINEIDLSNQAPGIYFVNIIQNEKVFIERFAISND